MKTFEEWWDKYYRTSDEIYFSDVMQAFEAGQRSRDEEVEELCLELEDLRKAFKARIETHNADIELIPKQTALRCAAIAENYCDCTRGDLCLACKVSDAIKEEFKLD